MTRAVSCGSVGLAAVVLLTGGSCSSPLCEKGSYDYGAPLCSPDRYRLEVMPAPTRIDLRDSVQWHVPMIGRGPETDLTHALAELPGVVLDFDGSSVDAQPLGFDPKAEGVVFDPPAQVLKLGPLRITAKLSTLEPASSPVDPSGWHRVFRSPKLDSIPSVTFQVPFSEKGKFPNFLREAKVVWASDAPDTRAMHVVLIEDVTNSSGIDRRWLGRYLYVEKAKPLAYVIDAMWSPVQAALDEGKNARLGLIPKTAIVYDDAKTPGMFQLSMLQYGQKLTAALTARPGTTVPTSAIALATCSEEPVVMLAEAAKVSLFRVEQLSTFGWAQQLSSPVSVTNGPPVIAARDPIVTSYKAPSDKYLGVVWESGDGTAHIISVVTRTPDGAPDQLRVDEVKFEVAKGLTAAALADLDSDGLQDLIVAQADGTLAWSPLLPDGSFGALNSLGANVPEGITSISVGDISGDKLPDVVVGCKDGRLRVFYNQQ